MTLNLTVSETQKKSVIRDRFTRITIVARRTRRFLRDSINQPAQCALPLELYDGEGAFSISHKIGARFTEEILGTIIPTWYYPPTRCTRATAR